MRPTRILLLSALMLALAACGGATTSATPTGATSDEASASAVASVSAEASASAGEGGGGDAKEVADALVPPNSRQVQKHESSGVIFAIYTSTDSFDSLKTFYESAIPDAGMKIISPTEQSGTVAWVFAKDEGSTFGGAVSISPASDGSGNAVSVTVGETQ
jgi:hypothetical protein